MSRRSEIAPSHAMTRLADLLEESVALLAEANLVAPPVSGQEVPEASLLQQCLDLVSAGIASDEEPIRTVHHFACTGGTVISKCVAAMPNVRLLSEVDPLSPLDRDRTSFAPTNMSALLQRGSRSTSPRMLADLFHSQLEMVYRMTLSQGGYLVLRDHSHSHFCTGPGVPVRPSLRELAASVAPVRSLVTVRDPVDSFTSLRKNGWEHFQPATFDEYCRRYLSFLRRYQGVPVIRYEDFVVEPERHMQLICEHLALPYFDQFASVFSVFDLSGGSGRRFSTLNKPKPRPERIELQEEANGSVAYRRLAEELGYTLLGI